MHEILIHCNQTLSFVSLLNFEQVILVSKILWTAGLCEGLMGAQKVAYLHSLNKQELTFWKLLLSSKSFVPQPDTTHSSPA